MRRASANEATSVWGVIQTDTETKISASMLRMYL
jgi:hypothetical protein